MQTNLQRMVLPNSDQTGATLTNRKRWAQVASRNLHKGDPMLKEEAKHRAFYREDIVKICQYREKIWDYLEQFRNTDGGRRGVNGGSALV